MNVGPYAGVDVLTLPRAKLERVQDDLLRAQVELCYRAHPFYSDLMRREGIRPEQIRTRADLELLPVTTKADFLADPEAFRLRDDDALAFDEQLLWDVIYTTGSTTGSPVPVYSSARDYWRYLATAARSATFINMLPGDVLLNLFPLTPFPTGAFQRLPAEAAACGAAVVAALPGRAAGFSPHRSLDAIVDLAAAADVTSLAGVAGFVRRLLIRARERDVVFPRLRMCTLTGESSSPAFVADVLSRMRAAGAVDARVVNRYGSTEQGTSMVECSEGSGFHDLAPEQVLFEVLDSEGGAPIHDEGVGQLVFTHLVRRGTVLLRFAVGDLAALTPEKCPRCELSTVRLISNPSRTKDIVKLKGTLVNTRALGGSLDGVAGVDEYQFVVARPSDDPLGPDELTLRVAVERGAQPAEVAKQVAHHVTTHFHVSPKVELVERDEIFDPLVAVKPVRFVDVR